MTIHDPKSHPARGCLQSRATLAGMALLACLLSATPAASSEPAVEAARAGTQGGSHSPPYCTATALRQYAACLFEVRDTLFTANAICLNVSDRAERRKCSEEAAQAQSQDSALCREQRDARSNLCAALGEARYDPSFDPRDFDSDFRHLSRPNPWRPLGIGYHWSYAGGEETTEIQVLDKTKAIEGVTCIVVNDRVEDDGELVENTDDWFAQAKNGDVYYCGEETGEYEYFDGDRPREAELVSIDGAFKWGRDGDKGGVLFPGMPRVGKTFRQELSLGNAEDAARVMATHYRYGRNPKLDKYVPRAFIRHFCDTGDCVVTAEFTPLEPGALEYKYFAAGIGLILEVDRRSGDTTRLVDCNFDSRCDHLPMP